MLRYWITAGILLASMACMILAPKPYTCRGDDGGRSPAAAVLPRLTDTDTENIPRLAPAHPGRLDKKGRLNFGVDSDPKLGEGLEAARPELLIPLAKAAEGLLDVFRDLAALPARLETAFWRGGFVAGVLTTCSLEGALALLLILTRRRE